MTNVASESTLRLVVRSSMHPWLGNLVAIGRVVVYYAMAAQAFSAGITCQHRTQTSYQKCFNAVRHIVE